MLYAAGRGMVWMLKVVAIVVVLSYAISGCMARHPELTGPASPVSVNAGDDVAKGSSAQQH